MTTPPDELSATERAVLGAGLGCLAGAFVLPLVVFVAVIIANRLNPVCGTPADSGGCEMGLVSSTITAIVPGVLIGIAVGVALGLRNSRQKPRS